MARIFGTNGSDLRIGTRFDDIIRGGPILGNPLLEIGNDVLKGRAGNDTIFGFGGRDRLEGGDGRDFLDGGTRDDRLFGDDGNDVLVGGAGRDLLDGGDGFDVVNFGREFGLRGVRVNLSEDVSQGGLSPGKAIDAFGFTNALLDVEGVIGTKFADRIYGNEFDNVLTGAAGNDILAGGAGIDILRGGLGSDTFILNADPSPDNYAVIRDFGVVTGDNDRFALENAVLRDIGSAGPLNADAFFAGAVADDLEHRIIYDRPTGELFYDPDGNDVGEQILIAVLVDSPKLTFSDFVVI